MPLRMFGKKTFGKLGKRGAARLRLAIRGGLVTTGRSHGCRVVDVSREGCCLHLETLPRVGTDVLVKIERAETFGRVTWVRDGRCGVTFEEPLAPKELERLSWIVHNPEKHAQNTRNSATAMWR